MRRQRGSSDRRACSRQSSATCSGASSSHVRQRDSSRARSRFCTASTTGRQPYSSTSCRKSSPASVSAVSSLCRQELSASASRLTDSTSSSTSKRGSSPASTACCRSRAAQKAWMVLIGAVSRLRRCARPGFGVVAVGGRRRRRSLDGLADAAAHLAGGAVGEGDGDDLADLGAVVAQVRQVALGEDVRLAAAGAGGEHDRRVAGDDGAALLRRQAVGGHGPILPGRRGPLQRQTNR